MNGAIRQSRRRPSCVFAVKHLQEKEDGFYNLAAKHGQVMAFHGTKVENFYSILHNGFLGHLNKASLQLVRKYTHAVYSLFNSALIIYVSPCSLVHLTHWLDFTLRGGNLLQY